MSDRSIVIRRPTTQAQMRRSAPCCFLLAAISAWVCSLFGFRPWDSSPIRPA